MDTSAQCCDVVYHNRTQVEWDVIVSYDNGGGPGSGSFITFVGANTATVIAPPNCTGNGIDGYQWIEATGSGGQLNTIGCIHGSAQGQCSQWFFTMNICFYNDGSNSVKIVEL